MKKPVQKNPEETQEIQEHPDTLKWGTEFTLMENRVKVHQIDLPRLTLSLTNKKQQFNPELRGQQLTFGGHDFLVKSATGGRLYLLLVEITEKEVAEKDDDELCKDCKHVADGKCDGKWFAGCNDFEKDGEQNESL